LCFFLSSCLLKICCWPEQRPCISSWMHSSWILTQVVVLAHILLLASLA
jgi:hypothetical protein